MTQPNVEKLRRTREYIGANLDHWYQGAWRSTTESREAGSKCAIDCSACADMASETANICGTAYCFAGWGLTLEGLKWNDDDYVDIDGEPTFAHDAAQQLFGLTEDESDELFYSYNSLAEIDHALADIYKRAESC